MAPTARYDALSQAVSGLTRTTLTTPTETTRSTATDIALEKVHLTSAPGVQHLQGWNRRASLTLPGALSSSVPGFTGLEIGQARQIAAPCAVDMPVKLKRLGI